MRLDSALGTRWRKVADTLTLQEKKEERRSKTLIQSLLIGQMGKISNPLHNLAMGESQRNSRWQLKSRSKNFRIQQSVHINRINLVLT
jgi:hypothetical protein